MSDILLTAGMLAGGLGLFLLAMNMITDGLKLVSGRLLRTFLAKWTRSPLRGIFTGFTITALVQSSSAVTVATIGFVNAGLINLNQSLGVVFGTNIGTTMTAWLVALIGFNLHIEIFALPLIGLGMMLQIADGTSRRAALGIALTGFGLFFLGIDILKDAFEGLAATLDIHQFTVDGIAAILLFLVIGFFITVVTQSSSAAIAITLTAATGGLLGLYAAAAMVIGANVGTTSTAGFAVINATPNAKRVAAAHVIFNIVTGLVALLTLPLLFLIVNTTEKVLGLDSIPAITLALFHTTFNLLGVILMWPFSHKLVHFLESRFVTSEEIEANPRYLDKNIAASPALAMNALAMELSRMTTVVRRMALALLSAESYPVKYIMRDYAIAKKLADSIAEFISLLGRGALTGEVAQQMTKLLRSEQHLLACAEQALEITRDQPGLTTIEVPELIECVAHYRSEVVRLFELAAPEDEAFSFTKCEEQLERIQIAYDETKTTLLLAGAELRVPVPGVIDTLELNSQIRRMVRQMVKSMHYLSEIFAVSGKPSVQADNGIKSSESEGTLQSDQNQ